MISTWFETQFPLSVTLKPYHTCVSLEPVTNVKKCQLF